MDKPLDEQIYRGVYMPVGYLEPSFEGDVGGGGWSRYHPSSDRAVICFIRTIHSEAH